MSTQGYVFDARLADDPGVSRTVAVGGDQTLDDVHRALRQAFEWHGDFPYAFRLDDGRDYAGAPGEGVDVPLAWLGLRTGSQLQHDVEGQDIEVDGLEFQHQRLSDHHVGVLKKP